MITVRHKKLALLIQISLFKKGEEASLKGSSDSSKFEAEEVRIRRSSFKELL